MTTLDRCRHLDCAAYSHKDPASVTSRERNHIACQQSTIHFIAGPHLERVTAVATIKLQDFLLQIVAPPVLRFPVVIAPILITTLQVGFLQQVHLASNFVHHLLEWAKKDSQLVYFLELALKLILTLETFDYFPITVTQTFFTYLRC